LFFLSILILIVRSLSVSLLSIYYCLSVFSDTVWHESNHHSHPSNQSSIDAILRYRIIFQNCYRFYRF
jgi:hypothetical protein